MRWWITFVSIVNICDIVTHYNVVYHDICIVTCSELLGWVAIPSAWWYRFEYYRIRPLLARAPPLCLPPRSAAHPEAPCLCSPGSCGLGCQCTTSWSSGCRCLRTASQHREERTMRNTITLMVDIPFHWWVSHFANGTVCVVPLSSSHQILWRSTVGTRWWLSSHAARGIQPAGPPNTRRQAF